VHTQWLKSLSDKTVIMYTDGSRPDEGTIGAVLCIGLVNKGNVTFRIEGWCCLGEKIEVYDAEIHAVVEGLVAIRSKTTP
jgi:hypothetical protein